MAINVIDTLEPGGEGFSVAHAKHIEYSDTNLDFVMENNLYDKIAELEGILKAEPELKYINEAEDKKQYFSEQEIPILSFNFISSAPGKCTVTITENGSFYSSSRHDKGLIEIPLPAVNRQGSFKYRISAVDSIGRVSSNVLDFEFIYGGVTLTSELNEELQNNIFLIGENSIKIPYTIYYGEEGDKTTTDPNLQRYLQISIYNQSNNLLYTYNHTSSFGDKNGEEIYILNYNFSQRGKYNITLTAYIGEPKPDSELRSASLNYSFNILESYSIVADIAKFDTNNLTSSNTGQLFYRITTSIPEYRLPEKLGANIEIFQFDEDETTLIPTAVRTFTPNSLTSGIINYQDLGPLTAGKYLIKVKGRTSNNTTIQGVNYYNESTEFFVTSANEDNNAYETKGLIAYFDARTMDNNMQSPDIWPTTNSSDYFIKLYGLNYKEDGNGWLKAEDNFNYLSFSGDSYGIMYSNQIDPSTNTNIPYCPTQFIDDKEGQTLEISFKSKCIGELQAKVLTCMNYLGDSGYSLTYDKAILSSLGPEAEVSLSEDEWFHITFVIDKIVKLPTSSGENQIKTSNLENLNPQPTLRIYVNGCLSGCVLLSNGKFTRPGLDNLPLLLNGSYDANNQPANFGVSGIKMLRIYDRPLTSQQILKNYKNSLRLEEERTKIENKNDESKADVPVIYLIRNQSPYINPEKSSQVTFFSQLHSIDRKNPQYEGDKNPTSKNSWVNCTMWYRYKTDKDSWDTIKYDDVDVYLQGTSSLTYPVKNYQIKIYKPDTETKYHGEKLPFYPPNVTEQIGWYAESADYVYTLKCDFMEQSHKNNTCTAIFYENLMNTIQSDDSDNTFYQEVMQESDLNYITNIEQELNRDKKSQAKQYTQSRRNPITQQIENIQPYRDAINGFPILVFYNDNNDSIITDGVEIKKDYNNQSTANFTPTEGADIYAGTYMFNVDKEGQQLGFEIPLETEISIPLKYRDKDDKLIDLNKSLTYKKYPCISLEGTSNTSFAAAGAFYTLDEYNNMSVDPDTGEVPEDKKYFSNVYDYIEATLDPRYTYADDFEDQLIELYGKTQAEKIMQYLTFEKIKEVIDWVSGSVNYTREQQEGESEEDYNKNLENERRSKFRTEFGNYFSLTYCLIYFLQMQMFAQVDNAGKNAMFDYWGDKWYPRPYDMDTQMGFNNQGGDDTLPSVEINPQQNIEREDGIADCVALGKIIRNDDPNKHIRFTQYNTKTSQLWNAFSKYFDIEIQNAYHYLRRNNIYEFYNITDLVEGLTTEIIGEKFYNKDASSKYLNTIGEKNYLSSCQGNRSGRYKQFLKQRLTYLDTKYNYYPVGEAQINNDNYLNTSIAFRSDVPTGLGTPQTITTTYLGIEVYSPSYLTIGIGSGDYQVTVYVDQNSKYTHLNQSYSGVLLELPFIADNKDWTIRGAGNIKTLRHMEGLHLSLCEIGQAQKLTNLQIINSQKLNTITLNNNIYLREINLSGDTALGTIPNSTKTLDLSNCPNLKTVNIQRSSLTGIDLPINGAPINTLNLSETGITSLTLNNLQSLGSFNPETGLGLNLQGCTNITSIILDNVPSLTQLELNQLYTLTTLDIDNCLELQKLDLANSRLKSLSLDNCNKLKTLILNNSIAIGNESVLSNLNLSTLYGLETLEIANCVAPSSTGIHIQLPYCKNKEESLKPEEEQIRWNNLRSLKANGSNLVEVYYNTLLTSDLDNCIIDLSPLNQLCNCYFYNCDFIREIKGFTYYDTGKTANSELDSNSDTLIYTLGLTKMFENCGLLKKVTGTIYNCSSLSTTFRDCTQLTDLTELNFIDSIATSGATCCYQCQKLSKASVEHIIKNNINITNASHMFGGCSLISGQAPDISYWKNLQNTYRFLGSTNISSIPSNYFINAKDSLTSIDLSFYNCKNLTTVKGSSLIKDCTNLTSAIGVFKSCSNLTNFFDNNGYEIFPTSIETLESFFDGCTNLNLLDITLNNIFKPLINLKHVDYMFKGVSKLKAKHFPTTTGLFDEINKKLVSMTGLFSSCSNLEKLPKYLCTNDPNKIFNNLKYAGGIFENCSNLSGILEESLFYGMNKVQHIGAYHSYNYINDSNQYTWGLGAFANTKISGMKKDCFKYLPSIINIDLLFAKGVLSTTVSTSTNIPTFTASSHAASYVERDSALKSYYNSENVAIKVGYLPIDLFEHNPNIKHADGCFAGNIGFSGFCNSDGEIITGFGFFPNNNTVKNINDNITSLNGMFLNCSYNAGTADSPSYQGLMSDIYKGLFKNLSALKTVNRTFANCFTLTGSITAEDNIFENCNNLNSTYGLFSGCKNLGYNDQDNGISIPNNLFNNSARKKLENVAYMFADCGFSGRIGVGSVPVNGEYNNKGLLAECINLTTTEGMFANCTNLKGAIPGDIFYTQNNEDIYNNLTNISKMFCECWGLATTYEDKSINGGNYPTPYQTDDKDQLDQFIPTHWLSKCPAITNINYLFQNVSAVGTNYRPHFSTVAPENHTDTYLTLNENVFNTQQKIKSAVQAFCGIRILKGRLSSKFLGNSLAQLGDVTKIFSFCSQLEGLGDIQNDTIFHLPENKVNTVLKKIDGAFYDCSSLVGYGPDPTKFTFTSSQGMVRGCSNLYNKTMYDDTQYINDITNWSAQHNRYSNCSMPSIDFKPSVT